MSLFHRVPPPVCRAAIAIAVLLLVVLAAQADTKIRRDVGNDLTSYLAAADALAAGSSPYHLPSRFPYSYPLTLAWMIAPLRLLPVRLAGLVWFAASIAAFWWLTRGSATAAGSRLPRCGTLVLALAVGVTLLQIVQNELLNGQINLVVASAAIGSVLLSQRGMRAASAVLFGAGVALKLFPLIVLPWFVLRRRWVEIAGGLTLAIALCLVPVLWTGGDALRWTAQYFRDLAAGEAGGGLHSDFVHLNVSSYLARAAGMPGPPRWLVLAAAAVLTSIVAAGDAARAGAAGAAAYLALAVLVSPKSETHHLVFTIPALVTLMLHATTTARAAGVATLIVVFNIGFVTPAVRDPFLMIFAAGTAAWCLHDLVRYPRVA